MSKKLAAAAWTAMRYWSGSGLGSGRVVTFRSSRDCAGLLGVGVLGCELAVKSGRP